MRYTPNGPKMFGIFYTKQHLDSLDMERTPLNSEKNFSKISKNGVRKN